MGKQLGVQSRVKELKEEIEDKVLLSYFGVEDTYIPDWSLVKDDPLVSACECCDYRHVKLKRSQTQSKNEKEIKRCLFYFRNEYVYHDPWNLFLYFP